MERETIRHGGESYRDGGGRVGAGGGYDSLERIGQNSFLGFVTKKLADGYFDTNYFTI